MVNQTKTLSSPIELPCGLTIKNRLCKAAMAENLGSGSLDTPDKAFQRVYEKWADGEWGIIMPGNVMVDPKHTGSPRDLSVNHARVDDPEYMKAWSTLADVVQNYGSAGVIQICHPGRQSPAGAGTRGPLAKSVAPSAVALDFNSGAIATALRMLVFGTPRALTIAEIKVVIDQFVSAAKVMHNAGFKGVELHAAHGYLLAQFMSPKMNLRTDAYGGTALKRVSIVTEIIKKIRAATSPSFCIGIKLNSADHQAGENEDNIMDQIADIVNAGIDFIEISGGTYEKARMMDGDNPLPSIASPTTTSKSTSKREAYFLSFATTVKTRHPELTLMVTGGFRSRLGMKEAIESGACELVGVGRPAALRPRFPKEIVFNEKEIADDAAFVNLRTPQSNTLLKLLGLNFVGAGAETAWYGRKIRDFAKDSTALA